MDGDDDLSIEGLEWVHGTEERLEGSADLAFFDWEESALDRPKQFATDLRDLGLPNQIINNALEVSEDGSKQVSKEVRAFWDRQPRRYLTAPPELEAEALIVFNSARSNAVQRLRDWWSGRVTVVERREPIELRCPLFVLGAPSAEGCKAQWMGVVEKDLDTSWSVAFAGTGLGRDGTATVSMSSTFEALSGQTKLIFVPITVQLERISITGSAVPQVQRWRLDVAGVSDQHRSPGPLLLTLDAVPPRGPVVDTYPLAGDPTDAIATFERAYRQAKTTRLSVGLKAKGIDLSITASSTMTSTVALQYTLKSGRDYELCQSATGDGLLFV